MKLLLALFLAFLSAQAIAADSYIVPHTGKVTINEHGVCREVTNNVAQALSLFVPTKFSWEWANASNSFLSSTIAGVTLEACLEAASIRFKGDSYFMRTAAASGNTQVFTWSGWVKRSGGFGVGQDLFGGYYNGANFTIFAIDSGNKLQYYNLVSSAGRGWLASKGELKDPSAWYHIVLSVNSTTGLGKIYINGVDQTDTLYALANVGSSINAGTHYQTLGIRADGTNYFNGYMADVHLIDGQALDPTAFAKKDASTGQWVPKKYTGAYGTSGYHLTFANPAGLGNDSSGGGNHMTPYNFSTTAGPTYDPMKDFPSSSQGGNYVVWNPIDHVGGVFGHGNLSVGVGNQAGRYARGSTLFPEGKWYFETRIMNTQSSPAVGVGATDVAANAGQPVVGAYYATNGAIFKNTARDATVATMVAGDYVGVAYDSAGTVSFYKNGVLQQTVSLDAGHDYVPLFTGYSGGTVNQAVITNFGQTDFIHPPPTGFKAFNTANFPVPQVVRPPEYFKAVTYTGTGAAQTINVGFQPDLVWMKSRSAISDHALYDSARGPTNDLVINSSAAATTQAQGLTAFTSTGFTLGNLAKLNTNGQNYVAWAWKKGVTPGFDVVTYTGNGTAAYNVSHGLGAVPAMYMVKVRNLATNSDWAVFHKGTSSPASNVLLANTNGAVQANAAIWNATMPTTSTFTVGNSQLVNRSTGSHVAYLWSEIPGFSKFGNYTGNGSADGPFVYTGFKPAFLMVKRTDAAGDWVIVDSSRSPYNPTQQNLYANLTNVEETASPNAWCVLSANGCKLISSAPNINASGGSYIYAAFAEEPFKYATAR